MVKLKDKFFIIRSQLYLQRRQEKELVEQRSKQKYEEWYAMKQAEEKSKKKKLRNDKKAEELEKLNKKIMAEQAYKKWLRTSRKVGTPHSQAINGSLLQYLHKDKSSAVKPSYINPVPWVEILPDEHSKKSVKVERYSSPPLLWKEIESRGKQSLSDRRTKKRTVVKHSCVIQVKY